MFAPFLFNAHQVVHTSLIDPIKMRTVNLNIWTDILDPVMDGWSALSLSNTVDDCLQMQNSTKIFQLKIEACPVKL